MDEQPKNLSQIISTSSKVMVTIATAGSDKRVRLGRIIEYDALNQLISIQQEDDSICLIPLASISSIEIMHKSTQLKAWNGSSFRSS